MRSRLCSTFSVVSQKVWRLLTESSYYGKYARQHGARLEFESGLGLSEETITDIVLLEISKRHPYDVLTIKFNKRLEAQEGADWEWVVLSASGILLLRFQAKRVHKVRNNYEYSTLDHKSKSGVYQVKTLIDRAKTIRAVPLYMFYNFWDVDFPYWRYIPNIPNCCGRVWRTNFGITFASAYDIEQLIMQSSPSKNLSEVLKVSLPLKCLGCCNYSDLTESMYKFITRHVIKLKKEFKGELIHSKLPDDILQRLKGEFKEDDPVFTTFIIDRNNPHKEALETIKQSFRL